MEGQDQQQAKEEHDQAAHLKQTEESPTPAATSAGFKSSGFKTSFKAAPPAILDPAEQLLAEVLGGHATATDDADVDGDVMEDLDGEDMEDLDGEAL